MGILNHFSVNAMLSIKKIVLVLGSLCLAGGAQAQFGVTVGPNYTQFAITTRSQFQTVDPVGKVGYQVGAFYEHKVADRVSLVPEVQFRYQRTNLDLDDFKEGYQSAYQVRRSYVSVPLALRVYLGQVYLDFGSQVGALLDAREEGTTRSLFESLPDPTAVRSFNQSARDSYQRFDLASFASLGLQLPAGFGGAVRLTNSWGDVNRGNQPNRYTGSLGSVTIQTSLSYRLTAGHN